MQESKAEKREVNFYGDGHAAEKIVGVLGKNYNNLEVSREHNVFREVEN